MSYRWLCWLLLLFCVWWFFSSFFRMLDFYDEIEPKDENLKIKLKKVNYKKTCWSISTSSSPFLVSNFRFSKMPFLVVFNHCYLWQPKIANKYAVGDFFCNFFPSFLSLFLVCMVFYIGFFRYFSYVCDENKIICFLLYSVLFWISDEHLSNLFFELKKYIHKL